MKVLLINPPYNEVYSEIKRVEGVNPPIGLAYLAAYLRANNIEVEILDAHALQIGLKELETKPVDYDVIGVSSMTPSLDSSLKVLRIVKKINPLCKTVMGGPHISAVPIETMNCHPEIDFAVIGEGERTILELVRAIQNEEVPINVNGIAYKKNGKIKLTPTRDFIENIDELPFPAYDLLPIDKYYQHLHHASLGKNVPIKPFMILCTTRGCPYNCSFCASEVIWHRRVRFRSAANVLSEIDILINEYNIRVLDIGDENFLLNKKRLNELLDGLIERNYDIHFKCMSRVDHVNMEILQKLKRAGCYLIRYGVESGNQEMLNRMHKDISIDQIKRAFVLTKKAGISSSASFIIGHWGETKQSVRDTIELAKKINPILANFFIAIPLPGTELYNIAMEKNLIVNMNFSEWKLLPKLPDIKTEELTQEDLKEWRRKAYKSFYYRPAYIVGRLRNIKGMAQLRFYFKGLLAVKNLIR